MHVRLFFFFSENHRWLNFAPLVCRIKQILLGNHLVIEMQMRSSRQHQLDYWRSDLPPTWSEASTKSMLKSNQLSTEIFLSAFAMRQTDMSNHLLSFAIILAQNHRLIELKLQPILHLLLYKYDEVFFFFVIKLFVYLNKHAIFRLIINYITQKPLYNNWWRKSDEKKVK